jgi:hypothetical protein
LGTRLAEHAIHTWDVMVVRDPAAEVAGDAVASMIDHLGQVAARSGKTEGGPLEVDIATTDPSRRFRLSVSDTVVLTPSGASATPTPEVRRRRRACQHPRLLCRVSLQGGRRRVCPSVETCVKLRCRSHPTPARSPHGQDLLGTEPAGSTVSPNVDVFADP